MIVYLLDWVAMLVRWLHVITGVAWIGASFYFVWLDNHLRVPERAEDVDPEIAGELWAVHGGGFYRARKYRIVPGQLPSTLHWFYWEAYSTWLSGFVLLCLVYFVRAEAYLIDPAVAALSKPAAIAAALGALLVSWVVYDGLCRSPLGRQPNALAAVLGSGIAALAWALCHLFSGRGAFMLFGATLGTIMVANVFFVIIPGQRELVHAKQQGRDPDPAAGLRAKQRSVHNTYFTLPVLFVMISNHYVVTYGAHDNWLVLIAMSFAGASIRAWFVARHKESYRAGWVSALPAAIGILTLIATVIALAPADLGSASAQADTPRIEATRVQFVVTQRCAPCHSHHPTQAGFPAAPNGLIFESLEELRTHLPDVRQQLSMRAMPLGNFTGMTEEERTMLIAWTGHEMQR